MRESMARLTPRFSANRTVREYTEQHYLRAAAAYHTRAADKAAVGRNMVNWHHTLNEKWNTFHFGDMKVQTNEARHIFEVRVYLNNLDPNVVRVELFADGINGSDPIRQEMTRIRHPAGAAGWYMYRTMVSVSRPATDYTARIIPSCPGVAVPLENAHILWQR